jgi:penicillin amidase
MSRRRVALIAATIVVASIVVAACGASAVIVRSYPTLNAELRVIGLQAQAEVWRDVDGVPHIFAANEHDLFFVQGYVTAQDRLFQLDLLRRIGQGRLSELFGATTLDTDKFLRTLGLYRVANREVELLSPEARAALDAYAEGVNKYADTHRDAPPAEFFILGARWEPWRPADTVVIGKVMAWDLGGNMETELLRASVVSRLGEDAARALFPRTPVTTPPIIALAAGELARSPGAKALRSLLGGSGSALGSNNWVLAGARTVDGKPLLANDTHLGVRNPSIWYLVHLSGAGFNVAGFSIPGTPGVVIGHNERIAWGVTNVNPDVQDLYVELPDPSDLRRFRYGDSYENVLILRERIGVRGSEPVEIDVTVTRHGPVMTPVIEGTRQLLALRWTALEPGRLLEAVYRLDRASDWSQFRAALRDWDVPAQNFVYADIDGHIGYQLAGRIPVRAEGDGRQPVPGYDASHEWVRDVPFDELPFLFDPPEGVIVTANQRISSGSALFVSNEFDPGFRAQRIHELLRAREKWTVPDLARLQLDMKDVSTDRFLFLRGVRPHSDRAAEAQSMLREWDGTMRPDSAAAAIYQVWFRHMLRRTLRDKLGEELYAEYVDGARNAALALYELAATPDSPWFVDLANPINRGRDAIAALALEDALDELERALGADRSKWSWGRLHTITFEHPLGAVAPLDRIFNIGPFPNGGDLFTVAQAGYEFEPDEDDERYAQVVHPSMRMVVDLADFDRSLAIYATGQSGQPFATHWGDMTRRWLQGRLLPLRFSRDGLTALEGALVLRPR